MHLGIDFGTFYSSAALITGNTIKLVKDPVRHGYAFPSSVFLTDDGNALVGQAAENQRFQDLTRYLREFKRDLGQDVPIILADREWRVEELVTEVLKKLKSEAEYLSGGKPIPDVVLTVPAVYAGYKRSLMQRAAESAGFRVTLLEEPVAAATYYAWQGDSTAHPPEDEIVLVYDLGGGTFDAALVKKADDHFKLLALPVGLEHCGGLDFDRNIYNDLKSACSPELLEILETRDSNSLKTRLMVAEWCQDIKHQLSESGEAEVLIPVGHMESYRLTREAFNAMIEPTVAETIQLCHALLRNAGLDWGQVNRLLLVGGSCRIPYIAETLARETGRPISRVDDPEFAVCQGAAIHGSNIAAQKQSPDVSSTKAGKKPKTIGQAIRDAEEGSRIEIKPGLYRESIVIDTDLEIAGVGPMEKIIIESDSGPCIRMQAGRATLRNLILRGRGPLEAPCDLSSSAVHVSRGHLTIEQSDITSETGPCLAIQGSEASATVRACKIHDGQDKGVVITGKGRATLEDCEIFGHRKAGVSISDEGDPTLRNCRIYSCMGNGVAVSSGKGLLEECGIFDNKAAGLGITGESAPLIRRCKIFDGRGKGILFLNHSRGTMEDTELFSNASMELGIAQGSVPVIRRCRIHDGKGSGVVVFNKGEGRLEDCEIYKNSRPGVTIAEGAAPIFVRCRIYDGKDVGLTVKEGALGAMEECDIFSNADQNVAVDPNGKTDLRHCRIEGSGREEYQPLDERDEPVSRGKKWEDALNPEELANIITITLKKLGEERYVYFSPAIPPRKLNNAMQTCAIPESENVIVLVDCTFWGSAKNAMVFGAKGVYFHSNVSESITVDEHVENRTAGVSGKIAYSDFPECMFEEEGTQIHLGDGRRFNPDLAGGEWLIHVLDTIKVYIEYVRDAGASETGEAGRFAGDENLSGENDGLLGGHKIHETLGKVECMSLFRYPAIPPRRLNHLKQACRVPDSELILGLIDGIFWGSAEDGIVFGREGVYFHSAVKTSATVDGDAKGSAVGVSGNMAYDRFPDCIFEKIVDHIYFEYLGDRKRFNCDRENAKIIVKILETLKQEVVGENRA